MKCFTTGPRDKDKPLESWLLGCVSRSKSLFCTILCGPVILDCLKKSWHPKVLIPLDNEKDLVEIPKNIKDKLTIVPVKWIDEVMEHALVHAPVPEAAKTEKKTEAKSLSEEQNPDDIVRPH